MPTTALVLGSLTPDMPLWAGAVGLDGPLGAAGITYGFTHSLLGITTACLIVGCALWALWLLVRAPLYDALPSPLRDRLPPRAVGPTLPDGPWAMMRAGVGALLGLGVGAATHVLVDEFTHEGRWAHREIA